MKSWKLEIEMQENCVAIRAMLVVLDMRERSAISNAAGYYSEYWRQAQRRFLNACKINH
jgi:hypothetical protein